MPHKLKETRIAYWREYRRKNRDKRNAWERARYARNLQKMRDYGATHARESRRKLKEILYTLLGDKCVICGFSDKRALQIDHRNGGGKRHYSKSGSLGVLKHAVENPSEYQILCANHHWINMREKGEVGPCHRSDNQVKVIS